MLMINTPSETKKRQIKKDGSNNTRYKLTTTLFMSWFGPF